MMRSLFISIMLMTTAVFANSLSLEDNGDGTWNVGYTTDTAIAGFQFNVDGATILDGSVKILLKIRLPKKNCGIKTI